MNKEIDAEYLMKNYCTDAQKWAKSFIQTKIENKWTIDDIDEGLMISWFATIIMTAIDKTNMDK